MRPSDARDRDRLLKHLKQRPPVERPPDYGNQSPRLLAEIVDGMKSQYAEGEEERRQMTSDLWSADERTEK